MTNTESDLYDWLDERGELSSALIERIEVLATDAGVASGSWVDFADDATAVRCAQLDDDGDPEWWDLWGASSPLSGEFSDTLTPARLLDELELDETEVSEWYVSRICDAYEMAFYDAHRDAVLRAASRYLSA